MRFHHEQRYDAPPARVYAMLTDPSFREQVCKVQLAHEWHVTVEPEGDGMSVVVDQRRPSDGIPAFARKIVGDEIRVVQREDWTDSTAALDVTIPGKPGRLTGTITVTGDDGGTMETIDGELTVNIPLLGSKLEALIAELLDEALQAEQELGRAWLSDDN